MSIGKKLKEVREKKKITINQVYERTRIHPNVLTALEGDEYEKILNPTYIKSFLKTYASFLELDVNKILEEYNNLKSQKPKETSVKPQAAEESQQVKTLKYPTKNIIAIFKVIAILLVALIALRGMAKLTQNIKQQLIKYTQAQKLKAKAAVKPAKKKEPPKTQVKEAPLKAAVVPKGEKLILNIVATDDVWLQLKVDGKTIFKNMLKKNASESWQANENFVVNIGKPNAVKLTLNGNPLTITSRGIIKNLVIDREGVKK